MDICWIAYLTEKDKGKRIIFKTLNIEDLYRDECKELKTETTIVMYNGRCCETVSEIGSFANRILFNRQADKQTKVLSALFFIRCNIAVVTKPYNFNNTPYFLALGQI